MILLVKCVKIRFTTVAAGWCYLHFIKTCFKTVDIFTGAVNWSLTNFFNLLIGFSYSKVTWMTWMVKWYTGYTEMNKGNFWKKWLKNCVGN